MPSHNENLKLPKSVRQQVDGLDMYRRKGKTSVSMPSRMSSLPVTLDPEAMQAVFEQAMIQEHRKMMTMQQDQFLANMEQMRLPAPNPGDMMPPE